jgi:hypothetical protein
MSTREETAVQGRMRVSAGARTDAAVGTGVARVFPIFTTVFGIVYFWGVYTGTPILRYYPLVGVWQTGLQDPLPVSPDPGPAMLWYGWVVMAIVVGAVVAGLALLLPRDQVERFSARWVWVPVALTIVLILSLIWLLSGYFTI